MVNVHKDQRIYLEDSEPVVPSVNPVKGRNPAKPAAQKTSIRVDKWTEQHSNDRRLAFMQTQRYWIERTFQDALNDIIIFSIRPAPFLSEHQSRFFISTVCMACMYNYTLWFE